MFSHRFLRGGLEKYCVSLYCRTPDGSDGEADLTFNWLENEDHENVAARFHTQLELVVKSADGQQNSKGLPPKYTKLVMHQANECPDADTLVQILAALSPHGPEEIVFAEKFVHLCTSSAALPYFRQVEGLCLHNCSLAAVPEPIFSLSQLRRLDISGNKLACLPADIGNLTGLESLDASGNQLTVLPESIKGLVNLKHLALWDNRITAPVLDPRTLNKLTSLQLHNNPLRYLPEVSCYRALRSLSLANVRVTSDEGFHEWTVTVLERTAYASISALRQNPLQPVVSLLFRRSSCQHPLLAGLLAKLAEEAPVREAMRRQDGALQQLVLMLLSDHDVVVSKACDTLVLMAGDGDTASQLEKAAVVRAIHTLMIHDATQMQMNGLKVLNALAVASDAVAIRVMTRDTVGILTSMVSQANAGDAVRAAALLALSSLAFPAQNKAALLSFPGLLQLLEGMASPHGGCSDAVRPTPLHQHADGAI